MRVCAAASESVKGYPGWEEIFRQLAAAKTRSVSPEEAFDMSEMGQAVLIDVRPREDYEKVRQGGVGALVCAALGPLPYRALNA